MPEARAPFVIVSNVREGPIDTCHKERPQNGQAVEGFNRYGLRVTEAEIEELDGNAGRLTVQLESPTPADGGGDEFGSEPIGDPQYELHWIVAGLLIDEHPRCGRLKPDRPRYDANGKKITEPAEGQPKGWQRTWDDWVAFDSDDYDSSFSKAPGLPSVWTLDEYKQVRELGVDRFEVYLPEVIRTTYYFRTPSGLGAALNKKQNPPPEAGAPTSGWVYRKTGDHSMREGRLLSRKETWLGATWLPALLYQNA